MKNIPRYWAYAETEVGSLVWRSSADSEVDAKDEAKRAARRVSEYEKAMRRTDRPSTEDYPYGVTLREKLLQEINDSKGELQAFITRNHAGAKVLNVRNVLFLDWDTPYESPDLGGCLLAFFAWIGSFFGGKKPVLPEPVKSDVPLGLNPKLGPKTLLKPNVEWLNRATEDWEERYPWAAKPELWEFMKRVIRMPDWSVRIYKTTAGYRGIATHDVFSPTDPDVLRLMNEFACDPLYVRLCKKQESFRARLTPKGWRCKLWPDQCSQDFSFYYPFDQIYQWHREKSMIRSHSYDTPLDRLWHSQKSPDVPKNDAEWLSEGMRLYQQVYEKAVELYEEASAPFATCHYLGTVGSGTVHPEIASILALHDEATGAFSENQKKLA